MIALAGMIMCDEDALVCDFAQTYHIYDYRALPISFAATLACGLDENSRIKRKLAGNQISTEATLLAAAVDRLSLLWWGQTTDGQKNLRRPASILELLQGGKVNKDDIKAYSSGEDFNAARARLVRGAANGN